MSAARPLAGRRPVRDRRPVVRVRDRKVEARRHDADDRQRRPVEESRFRSERLERDGAPENAGVALKVPLPRARADDDDVRAGGFVRGVENAAKPGAGAEHGERVRRHQRAGQSRGTGRRRHQRDRRRDAERQCPTRSCWLSATPSSPTTTCRSGAGAGRAGFAGAARSHNPHQPIGIPVRQRLEQHGVDDAEDRRGGADAEGEREHGGNREAGTAPQARGARTTCRP